MKVTWSTLYAFVVGRGYDRYGEYAGYHFHSYIVLPYEKAKEPECDHIPMKAALDDSIGCIRCGRWLSNH